LNQKTVYDAVIVGAGFYGLAIAKFLIRQGILTRVAVLDREDELMKRSSRHNQGRLHNGYHYPRNFLTGLSSHRNMSRFVEDYPETVFADFDHYYAVASHHSKVTARQFELYCQRIGAPLHPVERANHSLFFNSSLLERIYRVEEYQFDALKLAKRMSNEISSCDIVLMLQREVTNVRKVSTGSQEINIISLLDKEDLHAKYVFNCTYSGIRSLMSVEHNEYRPLVKHEIAEMALVGLPSKFDGNGLTVMDGPFFSVLPMSEGSLHLLSHVTYTPHFALEDMPNGLPYLQMDAYKEKAKTRFPFMVRDAARYIPAMINARHVDSWYEIKTTLLNNEEDDGRPILFRRDVQNKNLYHVLGGKMDNIYDILVRIEQEKLLPYVHH
jgi:glycine/D-amino acid oxidase-like deaminating enzyme